MHHRGRRILAWLLTAAVTLGSNSVIVLAENIDPSETQTMEEAVTTEENQEQDIQADIPVMEEDENGEAFDEIGGLEETETDEIVPENEDETELQEEELFSAGDGEKSDPEDYSFAVIFQPRPHFFLSGHSDAVKYSGSGST